MRKNPVDNARVNRQSRLKRKLKSLYYSVYEVTGLNQDALINALKRNDVILFDLKKLSNKRLRVRIYSKDDGKFFAITSKMCYNVKKLKNNGKFYPLVFLYRNLGVLIGIAFFTAFSVISNDVIFSFSFTGSGSVYSTEVVNYLNDNGIRQFTRFSSIDMSVLADGILSSSKNFSFVSCEKVGNRLEINLAIAEEKTNTLNNNGQELYSDVCGVVEKIKVYRGTALVSVGDEVKAGDKLVSGTVTVGTAELNTGCLAFITLITEFEYSFISEQDNASDIAIIFASQMLGEKDIVKTEIDKEYVSGEYVYSVTLFYRHVLSTIE